MADLIPGLDPTISRMASADAALVKAKAGLDSKKLAEIDAAAKDFEAMFASEMLSHMFSSVGVDPMFGGGDAEETWRGLMIEQYGKEIVKSGGIGLSDAIKAQMIALQEKAP